MISSKSGLVALLSILTASAYAYADTPKRQSHGKVLAASNEKDREKKASTSEYKEVFDFRGIKLGMTVKEFKEAPIPSEAIPSPPMQIAGLKEKTISVKAECTNDDGAADNVKLFVREKDLGVTECAWIVRESSYATTMRKSNLYVAGVGTKDYRFRFIALPGEEPRLFSIELDTRPDGHASLIEALVEKFGPPTSVEKGAAQNRLGAVFENDTIKWENSTGEIDVFQRTYQVDIGLTTFILKSHFSYFGQLLKEKRAKAGPGV